jgi:hypothetical protein
MSTLYLLLDCLIDVNYNNLAALEDYLKLNVNLAY